MVKPEHHKKRFGKLVIVESGATKEQVTESFLDGVTDKNGVKLLEVAPCDDVFSKLMGRPVNPEEDIFTVWKIVWEEEPPE